MAEPELATDLHYKHCKWLNRWGSIGNAFLLVYRIQKKSKDKGTVCFLGCKDCVETARILEAEVLLVWDKKSVAVMTPRKLLYETCCKCDSEIQAKLVGHRSGWICKSEINLPLTYQSSRSMMTAQMQNAKCSSIHSSNLLLFCKTNLV